MSLEQLATVSGRCRSGYKQQACGRSESPALQCLRFPEAINAYSNGGILLGLQGQKLFEAVMRCWKL